MNTNPLPGDLGDRALVFGAATAATAIAYAINSRRIADERPPPGSSIPAGVLSSAAVVFLPGLAILGLGALWLRGRQRKAP